MRLRGEARELTEVRAENGRLQGVVRGVVQQN